MKFLNSLYSIVSKNVTDSSIRYDILLDASHFIYQAHFPEEPITPGVCIIQIAKELMENHLHQMLSIKTLKKIIIDNHTKTIKMQSQILSEEVLLAKLSIICKQK